MIEERLRSWAAARGYALAIAGVDIVEAVRRKLESRRASGEIEAGFFRENLGKFRYLEGAAISGPARIVMVALPAPIHVVPLAFSDGRTDALIPPTYVRYIKTFGDVLADLKENALGGASAETLKAPLKSLAVHMGLVVYGRNNITYVPGRGSGHQLCGYLVGSDEWPGAGKNEKADWEEKVLERCSSCRACINVCPTGAIREDRFLISAERCFTLHSESRKPIPPWVRRPKSVCLIGCMDCQKVCPENKGRLKTVPSGVEFSAGETEAVLEAGRRVGAAGPVAKGEPEARRLAWASAWAKFKPLGLTEDLDLMGRNLDYFMSR